MAQQAAEPEAYQLRVTAGPSYDTATHVLVPVNSDDKATVIESADIRARVRVRIRDYRGLPKGSPSTCAYFEHEKHKHDLYSIQFSFTLPGGSVGGDELVFGNDFEHPIRDKLPTGFGAALRLVRWSIDPGLDGDVYADKPYLYGPLLSSINVLNIGSKRGGVVAGGAVETKFPEEAETGGGHGQVLEEGADGEDAEETRDGLDIPDDSAARMKHFLNAEHKKQFTFEKGRTYACDFFNSYLDFNQFALRLPGITLHLMRFWDGQPLRYVLKHRSQEVDKELLVISFALVSKDQIDEEQRKWDKQSEAIATASPAQQNSSSSSDKNEQKGREVATSTTDDDVD